MSRLAFAHRTRSTYKTRSNRTKLVRTPGNKLVRHKVTRVARVPRCPISGEKLNGLSGKPPAIAARKGLYARRVARPYGGHLAAKVVRDRILKAFLQNEKQCVQAVLHEKARLAKAEAKKTGAKKH